MDVFEQMQAGRAPTIEQPHEILLPVERIARAQAADQAFQRTTVAFGEAGRRDFRHHIRQVGAQRLVRIAQQGGEDGEALVYDWLSFCAWAASRMRVGAMRPAEGPEALNRLPTVRPS